MVVKFLYDLSQIFNHLRIKSHRITEEKKVVHPFKMHVFTLISNLTMCSNTQKSDELERKKKLLHMHYIHLFQAPKILAAGRSYNTKYYIRMSKYTRKKG